MSPKDKYIDETLKKRKRQGRFRQLNTYEPLSEVVVGEGQDEFINFSGNDYLGLSKHPKVKERAQDYIQQYGAGSTASRLICGTYSIHEQLEQKLAMAFGREAALLFNSGFQANSTIIGTVTDRHALILADKLSHNSLLQGSLCSRATLRRFEHNNVEDLKNQLEKASSEHYSQILIITESLFSMDGDRSPLAPITNLAGKYNARLFVDDAHAMGVWGNEGLGLTYGISGIDMVLGTCGKAFGGFGAFLLCSSKIKEYLINYCPGFIYTTALPPAVLGAIDASLEMIRGMDEARDQLRYLIKKMRRGIHEAGYSSAHSESHIIPIIIGEEQNTLELADFLKRNGFLATAIRPPTVPEGSARIRITLSSAHTDQQVTKFLTVLKEWNNG